jgi:nucleotide-binding universal stress UspA family protein
MPVFSNVLVATDFGDSSRAALAYARHIAGAFGSTLHVLHVAGNVVAEAVGVEGYTTDYLALQREVEEAARSELQALITEADRRTLSARTEVLTADAPAQAIVAFARKIPADLIVIGTHGRRQAVDSAIGSVAERVARTAPCPVLTVRPTARP